MSYKVLARKWRPQHFRDMLGQEPVLRALANALDTNRLHHAYLFTGMRGVGKTTIARIFAKCLNCETNGVTSDPCGTCSACEDIDAGRFFDLIEVDAASRTKVESTRELLENVPYAPASGRYKVYLIDEVHMFSTHSFNALLKTLEEPPEHVKFILATTDPQKVPATVLSRCLQFNLKKMSPGVLTDYLSNILNEESIEHDRAALDLIARASEGSVRDSLSLVEQAAASGEGAIRAVEVESMLGRVSVDRLLLLLETLAAGDIQKVFVQVEELAQYAPDFSDLLGELLSLLHRIAMLSTVKGSVDENAPGFERLSALATSIEPDTVQLFYQIGLHARRDMPYAPDEREAFDMALLRMHEFKPQSGAFTSQHPASGSPGDLASGVDNGLAQGGAQPAAASTSASVQGKGAQGTQAPVQNASLQKTSGAAEPASGSSVQAEPDAQTQSASGIPKAALAAAFAPATAASSSSTGVKSEAATTHDTPQRSKGLPVRGSVSAGSSQAKPSQDKSQDAVIQQAFASSATSAPVQHSQVTVHHEAADEIAPEQTEAANSDDLPRAATAADTNASPVVQSTIDKTAIKASDWPQLVSELDIAGMPLQLANHCVWLNRRSGLINLKIESSHEHMCEPHFFARLEQSLGAWLGEDIKLNIDGVSEKLVTPTVIAKKQADDELAAAHDSINLDPIVQQLVERVDGSVDVASIRPLGLSPDES